MFYDSKLMNNPCLRNIWRAANDQIVNFEDGNLPDICNWLDKWISSDSDQPRGRLSLRTAAVLVDGAAKIYERRLKRLIEDIDNLENDMIKRKRLRCITQNCDEYSANQDKNTWTSENTSGSSETFTSNSMTTDTIQRRRTVETSCSSICTETVPHERIRNSSRKKQLTDGPHKLKKRGIEMQTYSQSRYQNEDILMDEFDKNLPFGYVMIYNNARDRIPRKIIFSSFNKEIQNLI